MGTQESGTISAAEGAERIRVFSDCYDVRLSLAHRLLVFCDWDEKKAKQLLDIFRELQ